ncbi:MAG: SpaH/EbpB family LPXTG-anchored major pilin [Coriobacteriia bacterium]|nr:SpaH/EbpB family LPXTG-anchored major pilin [Coriobacteriia bacterium]
MKKVKKRVIGLLLAFAMLAMLVAGGVPAALAAGPSAVDIVVHAPSQPAGMTLDGRTISLYKIFDLSWDGADAYTYKINSAFDTSAYRSALNTALGTSFASGDDILDYLQGTPDMEAFGAATLKYVEASGISYTYSATATGASHTFTGCALGYYLVTGSVPALDPNKEDDVVYSAAVLVTNADLSGEFDIDLKLDMPSINKWVYDTTSSSWGKTTDANIGDTVQFKLTSTVPDRTGYGSYTFIMHDTLSAGLTPSWSPNAPTAADFKITIGGVDLTAADYTVTPLSPQAGDGSYAFSIDFNNFMKYDTDAEIVVTYSAVLNSNAKVSTSDNIKENPNTASLEYSNNPNDTGEGGSTNTTTDHEVDVYTYALDIYKYTGTLGSGDTALALAKFELRTNATDASTAVKFTSSGAGAPYCVDNVKGTITTLVSGDDGMIHVAGLDEGTYYLVETQAPDGYNPLSAPIPLTIDATMDTSSVKGVTAISYSYKDTKGDTVNMSSDKLDVQNNSGNVLPATGGIGTTIFTIVGATVMIVVLIVLVARRKLRKNEE